MAITTLNLRALNRSDTATSGQVITATSATAADFQDAAGGAWTLIKTITASSDSTISFVDGASSVVLDSTYDEYCFRFTNIHGSVAGQHFSFNVSIDGGSNYNVVKSTACFNTYHKEDGSGTPALLYSTGLDLANSTDDQRLLQNIGIENDESASGEFYIWGPASTTFKKHFVARGNLAEGADYTEANFITGFINSTSAVDAIQFSMSSGNIDSGKVKMYGIS